MTSFYQNLLIFGFCITAAYSQSVEDDIFHFTNPAQGNAVWILDESSLPWTGGYNFLRSLSGMPTTLLSVVDSSTGVTLGECVAPRDESQNQTKHWEKFQWVLSSTGLDCIFDTENSPNRVQFMPNSNPRTFSVRIQSVTGPACLREMIVQNEQPVGCPPHLSKNSFTAIAFNCSCPYINAANEDSETENEDVDMLANTPQFPLFKGIETASAPTTSWTLSPSPCAGHECLNNGTCLVSQEGAATCLCRNGFTGDRCELDVCSSVPCQNGGVCRSNSGIAYCECPPAFTGLLCESVHEAIEPSTPICSHDCTNGECVNKNGQAECECRQGFTGANCNVLDVCLGDAACSMFGPNAKCVLDDNMDKTVSASLINGTYDCLCPHPIHGQFVDCMQLHAPSISTMEPASPSTPSFPVLDISKLPTAEPTTTTTTPVVVPIVSTTQQQQQTAANVEHNVGFTVTREPIRPVDITLGTTQTTFNQNVITAGETPQPSWSSQQPEIASILPTQTQTTFIFPQTPETTTTPPTTEVVTSVSIPKFVSPKVPDEEETEDNSEDEDGQETFPTPSTMHIVPSEFTSQSTTFETTTETVTTTTEIDEEEEDDMTTEETSEATEGSVFATQPTTMITDPPTTTTEEEEETTTEESEEVESEEFKTTQTSLPFWMTGTTTRTAELPQPSPTPRAFVPEPESEIPSSTEGVVEEETVEEDEEELTTASSSGVKNMEVTTASDVVHHHTTSGKQSSVAASWIIAIIALIVLGLLLLATSLFILRYIRQSRKLHGKYNPAREEHNLSAAYAMPMSHIAKEERLI